MVSQKRKQLMNAGQFSKEVQGFSDCLDQAKMVQNVLEPPCHGVGKGLITSQGPLIHPSIPLPVKSKEFVVDTARSLVHDVDIDECSKHEVEALGDLCLFDVIKVSCGFFLCLSFV